MTFCHVFGFCVGCGFWFFGFGLQLRGVSFCHVGNCDFDPYFYHVTDLKILLFVTCATFGKVRI
jgi:hypothetical protein